MKWLEEAFKNNIGAIVVGIFSVIGMYTHHASLGW